MVNLRLSELSGSTLETFHLYLVLTKNAFICTNEPYSSKYNKTFLALSPFFHFNLVVLELGLS